MPKPSLKIVIFNLATLAFFVLDRWLKSLVLSGYHNRIISVNYNYHMAFGLKLINQNWLIWLIVFILLILIFGIVKLYRVAQPSSRLIHIFGFTLIAAGAISNLWDRLVYGYVVDCINLDFWPIFNLADVMIVIGAGVVLLVEIFKNKKVEKST